MQWANSGLKSLRVGAGDTDPWSVAFVLAPSTHREAHKHASVQFQGIQYSLLASKGSRNACGAHACMQALRHTQKTEISASSKGCSLLFKSHHFWFPGLAKTGAGW